MGTKNNGLKLLPPALSHAGLNTFTLGLSWQVSPLPLGAFPPSLLAFVLYSIIRYIRLKSMKFTDWPRILPSLMLEKKTKKPPLLKKSASLYFKVSSFIFSFYSASSANSHTHLTQIKKLPIPKLRVPQRTREDCLSNLWMGSFKWRPKLVIVRTNLCYWFQVTFFRKSKSNFPRRLSKHSWEVQ